MSLTSTPQSTDDERYSRYTISAVSPQLSKQLVQEVSLSYSAPYTSTVKHPRHYSKSDRQSKYLLDAEHNISDALHSHTHSFDSHLLERPILSGTNSVERFERIETEFPAKKKITEPAPYFSARSAIRANRATPASPLRATPTFGQFSTAPNSTITQNTIVSESSTFEELTTIKTAPSLTTRKKEVKTDMPTVNALTKQFETITQQERNVPLRPKKIENTTSNQNSRSQSRVVVIDKLEEYSNNSFTRPAFIYPQTGILTTTIVDIEPTRFGRRTEEYKIEEEYIVKKYDKTPSKYSEYTDETRRFENISEKNYKLPEQNSLSDDRENIGSPIDTSSIDVVRNVIEQFETKIGNRTRTHSREQLRSVSRVDMNDNNSKLQEKIIVHQRSESQPFEVIVPISPLTPVEQSVPAETEVLPTFKELETTSEKQVADQIGDSLTSIDQETNTGELVLHGRSALTPLPTADIVQNTLDSNIVQNIHDTKHEYVEQLIVQGTEKAENDEMKGIHENNKKNEFEEMCQFKNDVDLTVVNQTDRYLQDFIDTDYKLKTYEEWLTTKTRRRDSSQPPERSSPASYSSLSNRSKSIDRTYNWRTHESEMSRTFSEGRGLASGAYTGGLISGNLVSGMSSAGAICTTQIRDAREREKREIGLLNDRLADYIEKVRFLEAQNQCLSHDIDILRRGFSGGGHVSALFDSEISQAKRQLDSIVVGRATFEKDITALSSEIEVFRSKWLEAISLVKAHREDHDVDLDRLAKIEAEISLFKRKIRIVEEDVIRIRRENDGIYNEIARIRGQTHSEIALKNERSLHVTDLLQRIKLLQTENSTRIEQELVFIRRDTTADNRDYFRHELQAAIRDIRADYEAISLRNRQDIEVWYREQIRKIQIDSGRVNVDLYKEEIISIRSTLTGVKTRLAELESRNYLLEKLITDLGNQQSEEARFFEMTLAEKDAAIAKLRDQCTELSIQMEKLCDHETSLRAEIERYRVLLNGANVTTHISQVGPAADYRHTYSTGGTVGATRVVSQTTRTHSSSNTSYTGLPASRHSGITIGGNIGGISVGGTVGATQASAHVSGSVGGSEKRPDRIHDETGTDGFGRDYHRWYLGTISVNQVTPDFIELKNICKIRRVDVGGFRVEQSVNGQIIGTAFINVPLILDPQEVLQINTKNAGQFFMDLERFDNSINSRTSLFNYTEPTEERGWFVYLN